MTTAWENNLYPVCDRGRKATIYSNNKEQPTANGLLLGHEGRPGRKAMLRRDVVLWSEKAKKVILIELTVPWEEGCNEASERKRQKYQGLLGDCREEGWQAWLFPIEVGCSGFPAQ